MHILRQYFIWVFILATIIILQVLFIPKQQTVRPSLFNTTSLNRNVITVVNPHPFKFTMNPSRLCAGQDVLLLHYIYTPVTNFQRRQRIREMWGNADNFPGISIRTVFAVGYPKHNISETQLLLKTEFEKFEDIIQEDFLEDYANLPYKGVSALKWIACYCSHATFVLKSDDDVFVNMYVTLRILEEMRRKTPKCPMIVGRVIYNAGVQRTGRYAVTHDQYPNNTYPTYCSGVAFLMSTDVAVALHAISYRVKFLYIDDVYIAGMLPHALGLSPSDISNLYVMDIGFLNVNEWNRYAFYHHVDAAYGYNETRYTETWRQLTELARANASNINVQPRIFCAKSSL